jgi:hypothetical protein
MVTFSFGCGDARIKGGVFCMRLTETPYIITVHIVTKVRTIQWKVFPITFLKENNYFYTFLNSAFRARIRLIRDENMLELDEYLNYNIMTSSIH